MQSVRHAGLVALVLVAAACAAPEDPDHFVDVGGLGRTRIDVPRPTTSEDACEVAIPEDETVEERVAALRGTGLFADRGDESDAALARSIEARIMDLWGEVPSEALYQELAVAETDQARVWWRDLEADVVDANQVYARTLQEWADISVGAFVRTAVSERWSSPTGPVEVHLSVGDADLVLEPEYLEDWIDPRILVPINDLIAPSGRQFLLFEAFDQTAVVLALTEAERSALEDRGWCFE